MYYVRYYIDYVTHVESRKNLSIVGDRKSICIKIHDPIVNTVALVRTSVKKITCFLLRSGAKIRKIREKKGKKKGGKKRREKNEDVDDNLISEIIAIVTDRVICNLRYVMLASYRRRKRIVGN